MRLLALVSGGGTNLQAIIDGIIQGVEIFQKRSDDYKVQEKARKSGKEVQVNG